MLDRSVAVGIVSWSLYRGLIFGDGAGLDNMGFAIEGGRAGGVVGERGFRGPDSRKKKASASALLQPQCAAGGPKP
ncbi:unnamed protein product [Symbiodinium natans]|uniref:Uncharacterized protein n=1 Tax=Symbiodinium natans TaxID=878477 RepID=A0A812UEW6_9DINO|nr:unnamed protein product [Symbiodinium natans]